MMCPYCSNEETKVIDSRESKDGGSIKRRRQCLNCDKRFSTAEKVLKLDLEVRKSNGFVEVFSLSKIKNSIIKAGEKRPITLEKIEEILESVVRDLKKVEDSEIPTKYVGKIVLRHLKNVDEMAFLKYAIVHNNYETINEFIDEIEELKQFEKLAVKSEEH